MTKFVTFFQAWVATHKNDEKGAAMVEYGLLVALIAVVCILVITTLGTDIRDRFQDVVDAI